MIVEIQATIVVVDIKELSIIWIIFKVWGLMLFGSHQLLITEMVDIMDIGEEICINLMTTLDHNKTLLTLLKLAMIEIFGLWSMLSPIIWEILMKILVSTHHSIKDNIIMTFVQSQMLTLPITIKTEQKIVDQLILLILNNKMIMLEQHY